MKNQLIAGLLGLAAIIAISSCQREDAKPEEKCYVKRVTGEYDTVEYEYDSENRIIKKQYYDANNAKEDYSTWTFTGNKVEENKFDKSGNLEYKETYLLGSNGYATTSWVVNEANGYYDTTFYTYDGSGYLIEKRLKEYFGNNDPEPTVTHWLYTIANGNTVKLLRTTSDGETLEITEEYSDKKAENIYDAFFSRLTGKHSVNLISKEWKVYSDSPAKNNSNTVYVFEQDAKGNVVKSTFTYTQANVSQLEILNYSYSCK